MWIWYTVEKKEKTKPIKHSKIRLSVNYPFSHVIRMTESWLYLETMIKYSALYWRPLKFKVTFFKYVRRTQKNNYNKTRSERSWCSSDVIITLSFLEAKRSQSISNCVHLSEALPATKSVPLLLHTVSALFPGLSYSSCSHRLSGTVMLSHLSLNVPGLLMLASGPCFLC